MPQGGGWDSTDVADTSVCCGGDPFVPSKIRRFGCSTYHSERIPPRIGNFYESNNARSWRKCYLYRVRAKCFIAVLLIMHEIYYDLI